MNDIKTNVINKRGAHNPFSEYDEFPVTYSPIKAGTYNIYLYGDICSAQQFIGAVEVMAAATEHDTVIIHLSTNGGSLDATDTLIQAMRECEAQVVCKASGGVFSAGTIILLEADVFSLSEHTSFLIHNGSTGTGGKFSDYRLEAAYTAKYMENVLRTAYEGFLEPLELDDLIKGIDIWLNAQQFAERWQARNEYYKAKEEAAKKPTKKPRKPKKYRQ